MSKIAFGTKEERRQKVFASSVGWRRCLDSPESVVKLCAILEPLLCGDDSSMNDEALEKEQTQVASLAHLCRSESTDDVFRVLGTLRRALGKGGSRRTAYTLPALAYRGLELARVANGPEFSARKVFQFVHETATALAGVAPARALRVFFSGGLGGRRAMPRRDLL